VLGGRLDQFGERIDALTERLDRLLREVGELRRADLDRTEAVGGRDVGACRTD
jgi:hypothetical protein